jgi:TonB family protein
MRLIQFDQKRLFPLAAVIFVFSIGMTAWPQQLPAQTVPQQSASASANGPIAQIPAYPDSPQGLENLMKNMLKLQKKGDAASLAPYVRSLALPNPAAWFSATFGNEVGTKLASYYNRTRIELPLSFPDTLAELESKHAGAPHALRFTDSCNPNASDTEYPLLLRRLNDQPLYDVRFGSGWQYFTVRYFAYVDGGFRWLGNFNLRTPEFRSDAGIASSHAKTVKVGGNVLAAKRIKQVAPQYPLDAKYNGIQGTVILHALIDTDGSVQDLQVLQGTCSLAQAATKAVRQWRYSPTTIDGQPVRVDTTISVNFQLGR